MSEAPERKAENPATEPTSDPKKKPKKQAAEHGGPKGPEPTRYGDWERKGIAVDF